MIFTPLEAERQGALLSAHFPTGRVWDAKDQTGTNFFNLLLGFGAEIFRLETAIEALSNELDINQTEQLITEWEKSVGIPDSCFSIGNTLEERRDQVLSKIAGLGVQTKGDFEQLALSFGTTVVVTAGADLMIFPLGFPIIFAPTPKDVRFTMVVDFEKEPFVFPLDFPIQFVNAINGLIQCIFSKLRPATVQLIFRYGILP